MKTDISQFENYEELIEFFNNPVIQKEIELTKKNTTIDAYTNMLRSFLNNYIENIKPVSFELVYTKETGLIFKEIQFIDNPIQNEIL